MQKLLEVSAGEVLASGISPGLPGKAPILWADGHNVTFNGGMVQKANGAIGLADLSARPRGLKAAQATDERRLYIGAGDSYLQYTTGAGVQSLKSGLQSGGIWQFVPWGNHVYALNQTTDGLRYWNETVDAQISTEFDYALVLFRMREQLFVANTSNGANAIERSDVSAPSDWTPTALNDASILYARQVSGGFQCARPFGSVMGMYTPESLSLLSYNGGTLPYGLRENVVTGIGANSPYAVVNAGNRHWGVMAPGRAFVTDGVTSQELDDPAVRNTLRREVNWSRGVEVYGWFDRLNGLVRWVLPSGASDFVTLAVRIADGRWTKFDDGAVIGHENGVFDDDFLATEDRLLRSDTLGTEFDSATFNCELVTKPLDFGFAENYKQIDKIKLGLETTGTATVELGFSESAEGTITWNGTEHALAHEVFPNMNEVRDGVNLHLRFRTSGVGSWFQLNKLEVHGEVTSHVN